MTFRERPSAHPVIYILITLFRVEGIHINRNSTCIRTKITVIKNQNRNNVVRLVFTEHRSFNIFTWESAMT